MPFCICFPSRSVCAVLACCGCRAGAPPVRALWLWSRVYVCSRRGVLTRSYQVDIAEKLKRCFNEEMYADAAKRITARKEIKTILEERCVTAG